MEKFATSIKEKYQERLINREKQWPPCHSNKLVRLELVEREKGVDYLAKEQKGRGRGVEGGKDRDIKRFPLAYSDLFKVESGKRPVRKVLVEGDAGIGKTTLCISVSEDWANGKLFQQFELVLLLPLRMKAVASAGSLPELLKLLHPSPRLCESVARYLEDEEGESVLVIADGWDELSESERQEGSFLYQLLFGQGFCLMSVVVTSRPSASAPLRELPDIDRFVEVRGFSKEHIVEYIQSEFASDQEKAGRLLEQLESNPLLESVCSVPLNCAINCHLWRTLEEALPTTMTELYKKIILNVVLRNTQKNDKFQHISNLTSFDALPKELQQSWELLCKFAYEAVVRDQVVFSEEELAAIFPHGLENVLCFGLLQIANTILETGYAMSFHFLHLTFQEYLAAQYVVRQISESDVSPKQYMTERIVESDICRFICGIYFNDTKCTCSTDLEPYIPKVSPTLCHCAFEARDESVCFKLFERVVSCTFYAQSAYDCAAVLYVINYRYMFRDNIEIIFGNSGIRETQIRELADILARENGMLQVRELDLSCNDLTDKSISDLFQGASSCFQSLQTLDLRGNRIGYDSITLLGKSTFYQLRHLSLSDCPLGVSGMQALEDAVSGGSLPSLWRLCLAGSLTSDADVNGALLATSLDAILSCNLGLHYLGVQYLAIDLSRNNLGTPGASALATILCQCRTDSVLQGLGVPPGSRSVNIELGETILGDEGLIAFVEGAGCISVHKLSLNDNGIHAIGCSHLADGVCSGSFVLEREIILDNNPIGLQGAAEVGRILSSSYCTLRRVSLRKCLLTTPGSSLTAPSSAMLDSSITSTIRQKVCGHVLQNNVERLDLDCNNFTGDGVLILAGLLQLCPRLKMLGTSQCGITSADLKQLLQHLTNCKDILSSWLGYWDLSNNEIDDDGTVAMVDHLPSLFPNLGCDFAIRSGVKFIGNPISSERMRRTKEEIKRITEVTHY